MLGEIKMKWMSILLLMFSGCVVADPDPSRIPDPGNAVVFISDMPGEYYGTVRASARPQLSALGLISLGVGSSIVGFGVPFSPELWERLMAGEELEIEPHSGSRGSVEYEVRPNFRINRETLRHRIARNGDQLTWIREFGPATRADPLVPLPDEDPKMTMRIVFTPQFRCTGCVPGSEVGGGCIAQEDSMLVSEHCREVVEMFNLVEHGFVDPALFE